MNDNVIIRADKVQKYFNGGAIKALDGVSTQIQKGEVVVVIGPSGSGKSTFLRCLNLLELPTGGKIFFKGADITDPRADINLYRQKMGMVFQHFNLFPHMTILKNMTLAPTQLLKKSREAAEAQAMTLLERVGLADRANAYPSQLSGGQKQRIAIAGVLAMEPECIVLDEATAMLDPAGRREVLDTVHRLNRQRGITVVHITHHMSEAEDADRVIVMNDGVVAMDGTPRDIFSRVEELRSLGLAAPDTVELLHRLNGHGMSLPLTAITVDECARAIFQALHGAEGK